MVTHIVSWVACLECSLNYVLYKNDFIVTKYSSAWGTKTPFTLSCYISFFEQLLLIIHNTSCQYFVLSNIASTHIFVFFTQNLRRKTGLLFSLDFPLHFFFFSFKTVLPTFCFLCLRGKCFILAGVQGWNKRDSKLLASDWAIWWGRSINCSRMDSDSLGRFSVLLSGLTPAYTISLTACRIWYSEIDSQISFVISLMFNIVKPVKGGSCQLCQISEYCNITIFLNLS